MPKTTAMAEDTEGWGRCKSPQGFPHGPSDNLCRRSSNSLDYFAMSETVC